MLADHSSKPRTEELIIYGLLIAVGAIPVVIAISERLSFGVEATLGLVMVCAGALGAIVHALRNRNHRAA